jgi:AraC-like DNA-binding protein
MAGTRHLDRRYAVETSTTGTVPPHERADFWTSLMSSYHGALRFDSPIPKDFRGTTVRQSTPTYQLIGWRSDEELISRTPQAIKSNPDEDYRLVFPMLGRMAIRLDGEEVSLHPGRAGLAPMSEEFQIWHGPATGFIMTVPRREVDARLGRSTPRVAGLDFTTGLGRVVRDLATALFEERNVLSREQFDGICDRLIELLCMLLLGDDRPPPTGRLGELDSTVRRYIRENAQDRDLTPQRLAAGLGWSLRQIQLALQATGTTPRQLIKDERLKIARERLQNQGSRVSVTELAYRLGFSSVSAFSNAFQQRYGIRPTDLR